MPEDQALSVFFLNGKQIQFATQPPMIALLGFFALLQPGVEFFLAEERRAVDALHLRLFGIALPISAGQRKQLEGFQT